MNKSASSLSNFFKELRRRKVFQVAVVYGVVGWVLIQVVETIFPRLHLPDWSITLVIVFLIIGFPVAIILAWALELTPEGVKRTEAAEGEPQVSDRKANRKIELVLISLLAIAVVYLFIRPDREQTPTGIPPGGMVNSIAVLPFVDMSPQKDQGYFCDGVAEELLNVLAKVKGLRVAARTSSFSFKGKDMDITTIGEKLNVEAVLEGSVRKAGDKVRITAQLVKAANGFHLWSDTYDRRLDDIFVIQEEIARAVVDALKIELLGEPQARLVRHTTESMEAYDLYLLGRHYYNKGLEPDLRKAVNHFEWALELDSNYALACAGLADAYTTLGAFNIFAPEFTWPNARAMAEKAIALDEGLAEAHTSLAMVKTFYEYNWPEAEREFKRALEINPNSVDARLWYANFLSAMLRHDEAIAKIERALELDPHSSYVKLLRSYILYASGQKNEAIRIAKDEIDSDPDQAHPYWYWNLANMYASQGMYEQALASLRTEMDLKGGDVSDETGFIGYLYGRLGRKTEALRQLEALDELEAKGRYVSPMHRAWVYIGIDDRDQAFAWLEKGYERRATWIIWLKQHLSIISNNTASCHR